MVISIEFSPQETTNKNISRLSRQKGLAESLCADSKRRESTSSTPCCTVTGSSFRCQNFVGRTMKYTSNVSNSKYQRGHGKHGLDQISWPANSKQQGLLGHVISALQAFYYIYLLSENTQKKKNNIKTFEVT